MMVGLRSVLGSECIVGPLGRNVLMFGPDCVWGLWVGACSSCVAQTALCLARCLGSEGDSTIMVPAPLGQSVLGIFGPECERSEIAS